MEAAKEIGVQNKRQRIYRYRLPASTAPHISQYLPWQSQDHLRDPYASPNDHSALTDGSDAAAEPNNDQHASTEATLKADKLPDDSETFHRTVPATDAAAAATSSDIARRADFDPGQPCCSRSAFPELYKEQPASSPQAHVAAMKEGDRGMPEDRAGRLAAGVTAIITAAAERAYSKRGAAAGPSSASRAAAGPTAAAAAASAIPPSATAVATAPADVDAGAGQVPADADVKQPNRGAASGLSNVKTAAAGKNVKHAEADTFSYQKIRLIRETAILKHVKKVGFVLSGEPRLLWFNYSREVRHTLDVMPHGAVCAACLNNACTLVLLACIFVFVKQYISTLKSVKP